MKSTIHWRLVSLLLMASAMYGSLVAPRSLIYLEQTADLIAVGAMSNTTQTSGGAALSLQINRVIKGDPTIAGTVVPVSWPAGSFEGTTNSPDSNNGLWFLQRSVGQWVLLPVVGGTVPLSRTYFPLSPGPILSAYAYPPTASLSDKVASELSSAIETSSGYTFQLYALQYGGLDQLQSSVTQTLYQRLASAGSITQRILGLSGLIRNGNAASLAEAGQSEAEFGDHPLENGILLISIREHFRATDTTSVLSLGQIALDANVNLAFREVAAHALAAIHTTATLPYSATLLDDPNITLRVEAVGCMAAFANGLPAQTLAGTPSLDYLQSPASAPYRTSDTVANLAIGSVAIGRKEAALVAFWKSWWLQNRGNIVY